MPTEGTDCPYGDGAGLAALMSRALQVNDADTYNAKRDALRFDFEAPLEIRTETDQESEQTLCVKMENISQRGVAFWTHFDLEIGTALDIREWTSSGERMWLPASVAHSTRGLRGFLIGARFDEPLPEFPSTAEVEFADPPDDASPTVGGPSRLIGGCLLCMLVTLAWVFGHRLVGGA